MNSSSTLGFLPGVSEPDLELKLLPSNWTNPNTKQREAGMAGHLHILAPE